MNRLIILLTGMLCILLGSCSSDEPIIKSETNTPQQSTNLFKISEKDAIEVANTFRERIYGTTLTRSSTESIRIDYVTNPVNTRGTQGISIPDTLLYILNYGENDGFAIVSTDSRTLPIYAISDEGSISQGDINENTGLDLFFKNVYNDMMTSIRDYPFFPVDTINPNPNIPIKPDIPHNVEVISKVDPKLSAPVSKWGQGEGFNQHCPMIYIGFGNYPTGCNSVSLSQILAYNRFPSSISGHTIDWELLNTQEGQEINGKMVWPDDIGWMMYELGKPQYLNIDYNHENTGQSSGITDLQRTTLISLGYNDPGNVKTFPNNISTTDYPLLMRGAQLDNAGNIVNGHTWVIDGYRYIKITDEMYDEGYMYASLYHCVWGWDGKANGYFAWTTNGIGGQPKDEENKGLNGEVAPYFYFNVKYWGGISHQ